jgi:tetratricopeptide (TPR) repeat protein
MLSRPLVASTTLASTLILSSFTLAAQLPAQNASLPDLPRPASSLPPDAQSKMTQLRQNLKAAIEAKDTHAQSVILNSIGALYYAHRDAVDAMEAFSQVLTIVRKFSQPAAEATALCNLGSSQFALGHAEEALDAYKRALPLWRQTGNKDHEAATLGDIAEVFRALNDSDEALRLNLQS